ncbi:transcriptional regulator [Agarivorans sp. B2Z047]|uniref:winged helix-turn-helix transcriptional regulator n=1 Tax=Agarivorans sp. B2Z047 TaxID=2652721 RepID=UPI00128B0079|nr:helix-turn-helix domain-containing protein [Agarivorans sp. B2Z047]MPW28104.1 transcriptional regulator [Agarivorans sp. B2Z047]UQN44066.1 helix-turn-helix transcriptional regulator [Agarivorans sp. B2Z047]
MTRKNFTQLNCSIAQCLATVGDTWSFLILRDCFRGAKRFSEFESNLGIAKNILRNRLHDLVMHGVLEKIEAGKTGSRHEYALSEKGASLLPVLVAMYQWSEDWIEEEYRSSFNLCDSESKQPIKKIELQSQKNRVLGVNEILPIPK